MSGARPLAVLRPEPGNAATCARIAAAGATALALPLFAVAPLPWTPPDPAAFDALILTSANAVRHAGPALSGYTALPVFAVGEATAAAARTAGLTVALTGSGNAADLLGEARERGVRRALHLTGEDRADGDASGVVAAVVAVYASVARPVAPAGLARLSGSVALLHSPRAGGRLAELVAERSAVRLAAISSAALAAAGTGWARTAVAARPDDAALVAAALALAD